jgi:hypothetical protein
MTDIGEFVVSLDVLQVWSTLGLPGEPSLSCRCPKHNDSSASFSVYRSRRDGRWLWMCHAGCGKGDLVDLWVMMTGQTKGDALRDMRKAFDVRCGGITPPVREWIPVTPEVRPKPILATELGSDAEFAALAELRKLPEPALRMAAERGLLRFADHRGARCWVITDPEGWAFSCRPLGVNPWEGTKSLMVKNTHAAHLVGSLYLPFVSLVFMCEGGPDLLAAHAVIHCLGRQGHLSPPRVNGVAMLSASSNPSTRVCEAFLRKTVVIWAHSDPAGIEAAERWASQLRPYARAVHVIQAAEILPGLKDLNDVVSHEDGLCLITDVLYRLMTPEPVYINEPKAT